MTDQVEFRPTAGRDAMTRDGRRVHVEQYPSIPIKFWVWPVDLGRDHGWLVHQNGLRYDDGGKNMEMDLVRDADSTLGEEGWIPWSGASIPVTSKALVDYKTRGGWGAHSVLGWNLRWSHNGDDGDIIAYRLVQSPEAKPSGPVRYKQVPVIDSGKFGIVEVLSTDGAEVGFVLLSIPANPYTPDELIAAGETLIALGKAGKEMGE